MKFLVFLLVAVSLHAQDGSPSAAQIVTYWEPGDSHSYNLEMGTKMALTAGTSESFTSYRILVEVLDWDDSGYLVQWTYTDAKPSDNASDFERRIVEINEGLAVRYHITDLGEFTGVENFEEIATWTTDAAVRILDEFAGDPNVRSSLETVLNAFESKEAFERLAMEEIKFYHMLHGYSYLADDPLIVEGNVENPFGGSPILAKTTVKLAEINNEHETAYLVYTRTFDAAALNRALYEAMNGYIPNDELTPEQTATLPVFNIEMKKQFIFHTASGWLLEAYSERFAQTENESRIDTIYIEFLE